MIITISNSKTRYDLITKTLLEPAYQRTRRIQFLMKLNKILIYDTLDLNVALSY